MTDNDIGDLMTIVESCSKLKMATESSKNMASSDLPSFLPSADKVTTVASSSDTTMSRRDFEGLEELCMPFPSPPQMQQPSPPQKTETVANLKRRKKMQKKVVTQVPIDHSDDSWSWRKYGQKAIKGSPYYRGYYRCSTSKSCPARRHMEKSYADPTTLNITYTEEHNHPMPAHHDSVVGATTEDLPCDRDDRRRSPTHIFQPYNAANHVDVDGELEEGEGRTNATLS